MLQKFVTTAFLLQKKSILSQKFINMHSTIEGSAAFLDSAANKATLPSANCLQQTCLSANTKSFTKLKQQLHLQSLHGD